MKPPGKTITRFPSWIKCLRDLPGNLSTVSLTGMRMTSVILRTRDLGHVLGRVIGRAFGRGDNRDFDDVP